MSPSDAYRQRLSLVFSVTQRNKIVLIISAARRRLHDGSGILNIRYLIYMNFDRAVARHTVDVYIYIMLYIAACPARRGVGRASL